MKSFLKQALFFIVVCAVLIFICSYRETPSYITYGVSFSKFHADELKLDWKEVFNALLDDMQVKHWRLSAHWPMIEPTKDSFNFTELDYQLARVKETGGEAIVAVGRRLPGWPECHVPSWASDMSWQDQKKEILQYMTEVINRYKDHSEITYWQIENEPYLTVFAAEHCGSSLDEAFLKEEIALAKQLDPTRKVLVTDSGNLGLWVGAWRQGDVFGTSVYIYLWNPLLGQIKSWYKPFVYRLKTNMVSLFYGRHDSILIELSLEPWLIQPIIETPLSVQEERLSPAMFDESIAFAKDTKFREQYLWGAEWWYYMKKQGKPEYWDRAKNLFKETL